MRRGGLAAFIIGTVTRGGSHADWQVHSHAARAHAHTHTHTGRGMWRTGTLDQARDREEQHAAATGLDRACVFANVYYKYVRPAATAEEINQRPDVFVDTRLAECATRTGHSKHDRPAPQKSSDACHRGRGTLHRRWSCRAGCKLTRSTRSDDKTASFTASLQILGRSFRFLVIFIFGATWRRAIAMTPTMADWCRGSTNAASCNVVVSLWSSVGQVPWKGKTKTGGGRGVEHVSLSGAPLMATRKRLRVRAKRSCVPRVGWAQSRRARGITSQPHSANANMRFGAPSSR